MMTVIKQRPDPKDGTRLLPVENEDQASALLRFKNSAHGVFETSRIACGRKMGLTYVVTGTKGMLRYTQERMAELELYIHDEYAGVRVLNYSYRPGASGLRQFLRLCRTRHRL